MLLLNKEPAGASKWERKELEDGTILARIRSNHGEGWDYYIDQGEIDGLIYLCTTSFPFARSKLLSTIIWDMDDKPHKEPEDPHLLPKFNRQGWRI